MTVKLMDVCSKIGSGATPRGGKEAYREDGISLVRSQNVLDFEFSDSGLAHINDEQARKLNNVEVMEGDVLINITGDSVARACMMDAAFLPARVNQHVAIIRGEKDKIVNSYILYFLQMMKRHLLQLASSGATRNALTKGMLEQLELELPDIETQKRITSLLDSIQEKIALNKKVNDNLQQQARAIYKEWFIDFGQTSGTTPATWKHGKLKDVLQLHKRAIKAGANTTLPYLPIDTIPMQSFGVTEFRPNDEAKSSLITFQKDDIIVGAMRVYFHRVVLAPCDGITRTTCFTLSPYNSKYLSYALLTCDLDSSIDHAQNTSKGSTMPYAVWDGGMGEIEIVIPPIDVAEEFNNIVLPMLRQIQRNCEEIKLLGSLRDTLLPKLMSGEIDVSGIQL